MLGRSIWIPNVQFGNFDPPRISISPASSTTPPSLRTSGVKFCLWDRQLWVRPLMAIPCGQHLRMHLLPVQGSATQNRPTNWTSPSGDSTCAAHDPSSCSSPEGTSALTWVMYPWGHCGKVCFCVTSSTSDGMVVAETISNQLKQHFTIMAYYSWTSPFASPWWCWHKSFNGS